LAVSNVAVRAAGAVVVDLAVAVVVDAVPAGLGLDALRRAAAPLVARAELDAGAALRLASA
jgi:hypothetical protein